MIIDELLTDISKLKGVCSIGIGGSCAGKYADKKSDYDVYVYYDEIISKESRLEILKKYCRTIECNNTFWKIEDNCIMKAGIYIDY